MRAALRSPRRLRTEVLAGLVVALALIPEAISFSIIAGVDPRVGLFASFTMAVTIAFVGGRPAMISAATGAVALVIAPLVREHGVDYLFATVILAGVIQVVLGLLGVARLMRFVPRSVMVGFVNALAILIFLAQLPAPRRRAVARLPARRGRPRRHRAAAADHHRGARPAGRDRRADRLHGRSPRSPSRPSATRARCPTACRSCSSRTCRSPRHAAIIGPYALAMALVGLLESLMTAKLVDDITDTHSHKTREAWGQGVANVVTGFFGGMGGCAMIGQTMINVKVAGARTRISTFLAGVFLLLLVVGLGDVVAVIPMAALVAVMIMVSVGTFDWHSIPPPRCAGCRGARPSSCSPPSSSRSPPTTWRSASGSACSWP